jgi:hypothetical protein
VVVAVVVVGEQTLFKTEERESGAVRWEIRHGPGDYKTGKIYGERPPLLIAPHVPSFPPPFYLFIYSFIHFVIYS